MRPIFRISSVLLALSVFAVVASAGNAKAVRAIGRKGPNALPELAPYLRSPDFAIRNEAVKGIIDISSAASVPLLTEATRDNDAEIQIRATDGLVNFYLPGYLATGIAGTLKRANNSMKGDLLEANDQVIEPFVEVKPEVVLAIGKLVRGGASLNARANAARAAGILRGAEAVPDLVDALRSKDSHVIFEALIALQKIREESAGPHVRFLLNDLDERIQSAAIETEGILHDEGAAPDLLNLVNKGRHANVRRAALSSLAKLRSPQNRPVFEQYLSDRDDQFRAACAEGFGRLHDPADLPILERAWADETRNSVRLSLSFAMVMDGKADLSESSPLRYLINNLNMVSYRGEALPFLVEAARVPAVRESLYGPMEQGTRDEKIYLAKVLALSGDRMAVAHLEKISRDTDEQVASEGLRALRNLKTRL